MMHPTHPAHRWSETAMQGAKQDQLCFHLSTLILSNRLSHEKVDAMVDDLPQLDDPNYATYVDEDAMYVAQLLLGTT